jgi:hypothetical protein
MLPVKLFALLGEVAEDPELEPLELLGEAELSCVPVWPLGALVCDPVVEPAWSAGCFCEEDGLALVESGNVFGVAGGLAAGDCAVGSWGWAGEVDPWPNANGIKQATSAATNNSARNFIIRFLPDEDRRLGEGTARAKDCVIDFQRLLCRYPRNKEEQQLSITYFRQLRGNFFVQQKL